MFWDMNVTKYYTIRAINYIPKIHVSPQSSQKPPFRQITQNSPTISLFGPRELETSNFTANCAKFAQFANLHSESHKIHTILANIYHSLFFLVYPNFLQQNSQNPPNSQILRANQAELTNFALISINLLSFFRHL